MGIKLLHRGFLPMMDAAVCVCLSANERGRGRERERGGGERERERKRERERERREDGHGLCARASRFWFRGRLQSYIKREFPSTKFNQFDSSLPHQLYQLRQDLQFRTGRKKIRTHILIR